MEAVRSLGAPVHFKGNGDSGIQIFNSRNNIQGEPATSEHTAVDA